MRRLLTVGLGMLVASSASATEGLAWNWDSGPHRYLLRADVQMAEVMWVKVTVGQDARVVGFAIDIVTECVAGDAVGRRGVSITCTLDDLAIRLDPVATELGLLAPFAQELDTLYTGKPVTFTMLHDGRIRAIEIQDVDTIDRRINQIHQPFREMLKRALATLEVRLPRRGTDRGNGRWTELGTLAMGFPSEFGTMGRADVHLAISGTTEGVVDLQIRGEGVLGTGEVISINGTERPKNLYEMTMAGTAAFDTAGGFLVAQNFSTNAVATASSQQGEGMSHGYVQRSESRHLESGVRVVLPESGERDPDVLSP